VDVVVVCVVMAFWGEQGLIQDCVYVHLVYYYCVDQSLSSYAGNSAW